MLIDYLLMITLNKNSICKKQKTQIGKKWKIVLLENDLKKINILRPVFDGSKTFQDANVEFNIVWKE